ncbi:MAG TPA: nucleotidyltransferase family protein [Solirubrobacteraceae bacterium]|jgi:GNAT superfamily N-acetyltransferase
MGEPSSREQELVVEAVASNLRLDAATAEVLRCFEAGGVRSVLLKGPALADWYADDPKRSYMDSDLWVCPEDMSAAGDLLLQIGFRRYTGDQGLPDWWLEHASTWSRESDGVVVDLHRRLQGMGADPGSVWEALSGYRDTVALAGYRAPILSSQAKSLYVTLHAAHHGQGWGKALIHIERALAVVPEATWKEAAELARELDATDSFGTGLRLVPDGRALADRLGLPPTQSTAVALQASTPPPIALGFEQLRTAHGLWARVRIIARKLFPPPGFIRHWWPPAARNRWMLLLGYLYRPMWLVRRAPQGFRAWRVARRQVSDSR